MLPYQGDAGLPKAHQYLLRGLGPGKHRPPRHTTRCEPSFMELYGNLRRGEQHLAGPCRCFGPLQRHAFDPSFLELNGIL